MRKNVNHSTLYFCNFNNKITVYIFTVFFCLVPSIMIYIGMDYIKEPWIMILIIHWVIMIVIPFLLVEVINLYGYAQINYGLRGLGSRGDVYGLKKIIFCILNYNRLIMALAFCGITVGLYWLLCAPFKMDLKGVVKKMPFPKDELLKILAIVYFILVKPYVEEWFWRRYNYDIFLTSTETATSSDNIVNNIELEFWIVSFFWALTYTVIAIKAGATLMWAAIICLIFMGLGRFLIWMRWQHGCFANYITHLGICGGVIICYFLADLGKF